MRIDHSTKTPPATTSTKLLAQEEGTTDVNAFTPSTPLWDGIP
jgi:hypothetical protein